MKTFYCSSETEAGSHPWAHVYADSREDAAAIWALAMDGEAVVSTVISELSFEAAA